MQASADICARLEGLYREIQITRMADVPILNDALQVAAVGFDPYGDYYLGVLLTPWFMNLMLLPQDAADYAETAPDVGEKVQITLPAGKVEFIAGFEDGLGHWLSCSLFSPVFEFADQAAALETAGAVLEEVLNDGAQTGDEDPQMTDVWEGRLPEPEPAETGEETPPPPGDVSRRDFLRGGKASGEDALQEESP